MDPPHLFSPGGGLLFRRDGCAILGIYIVDSCDKRGLRQTMWRAYTGQPRRCARAEAAMACTTNMAVDALLIRPRFEYMAYCGGRAAVGGSASTIEGSLYTDFVIAGARREVSRREHCWETATSVVRTS